jgi:hypothetical protein
VGHPLAIEKTNQHHHHHHHHHHHPHHRHHHRHHRHHRHHHFHHHHHHHIIASTTIIAIIITTTHLRPHGGIVTCACACMLLLRRLFQARLNFQNIVCMILHYKQNKFACFAVFMCCCLILYIYMVAPPQDLYLHVFLQNKYVNYIQIHTKNREGMLQGPNYPYFHKKRGLCLSPSNEIYKLYTNSYTKRRGAPAFPLTNEVCSLRCWQTVLGVF